MQLDRFCLQLQPGSGFQGVLGAAATVAALKQLRLKDCRVVDREPLLQFPAELEHLSIWSLYTLPGDGLGQSDMAQFSTGVLQQLQHLTHLDLGRVAIVGPNPALQLLQALTRLVELELRELSDLPPEVITSSMLSGMQQLTDLSLGDEVQLEPDVLAGLTQLQRLCLSGCEARTGAAGVAQLLSHLQPLQQLTHLSWHFVPPLQLQRPKQALAHLNLHAVEEGCPAAAAYAALTASSKLQYLEISYCQLPPGVWQHLFPSGRHLPNLQSLNISGVRRSGKDAWEDYAPAPEGRLVSCCPALQCLNMEHLCNPEVAVVQGLSKLQSLRFTCGDSQVEVLQAVCHLTGLRSLKFQASRGLDAGPDALGSS